jgi:hypothetical protein
MADIGIRGQMKDGIHIGAGFKDGGEVKEITQDQGKPRRGVGRSEKLLLPRDIAIDADNFMSIRKQAVDCLATNESGSAGD